MLKKLGFVVLAATGMIAIGSQAFAATTDAPLIPGQSQTPSTQWSVDSWIKGANQIGTGVDNVLGGNADQAFAPAVEGASRLVQAFFFAPVTGVVDEGRLVLGQDVVTTPGFAGR